MLWPAQVAVLWQMMTERLIIILKARQLGISWLCCAYALWLCLFQPGRLVLIFSRNQALANENKRRIEALYHRLPDWMREAAPQLTINNTTTLAWSNGSRIESEPATQSAGRGKTASLVIFDEAAFMQWAETIYVAMKPTIDGGGQLIILSTANGLGGLFHQLWTKASSGLNKFKTIFLPWWSRPGRDLDWYEDQINEATDPETVKQEYPSNALEAFLTSGRTRFKWAWLQPQTAHLSSGLDLDALPDPDPASDVGQAEHDRQRALLDQLRTLSAIPGLTIYRLPIAGRRYVLGADVAEGKEHGDYSAGILLDAASLEEVAQIHGHFEPDTFGDYLVDLASVYQAELAPERNNHGHATIAAIKRRRYPRLIDGHDDAPGWLTNQKSKPLAIDGLAIALRDQHLTIHTEATLAELRLYQINKDGTTSAPPGYHDDRVMALSIARHVAQLPPHTAATTKIAGLWQTAKAATTKARNPFKKR